VGTLAVLALAAYLVTATPGPGPLAAPHASIPDAERMSGCVKCHADDIEADDGQPSDGRTGNGPAAGSPTGVHRTGVHRTGGGRAGGSLACDGLTAGCLACHGEIAAQVREDRGYHAFLLRGKPPHCKECHPDHQGRDFELTPVLETFDHPHVEFALGGAHEGLACEKCHARPAGADLAGSGRPPAPDRRARRRTFLGLSQACASCHENVHKEERFHECSHCHGQETFKGAAGFAHEKLPLANGHRLACGKCHEDERNYASVRGKRCEECHRTPHRADFGRDCDGCHARDAVPWALAGEAIDAALHERTGFPLTRPHDGECAGCHEGATFAVRFRDPPRPLSSCAGCHEDVHKGQFAGKACLECHTADRWKPARVDHRSFPLRFAHADVECSGCHESGGFRGTPRTCAECHEDRHKGQFGKAACDACHTEKSFLPSLYGISRHDTFLLTGAHRAVACSACHAGGRFRETPRSCRACHEDAHGGQFGKGECSTCHPGDSSTFAIRPFDHAKRAGYALEGAHAEASCARCHVERKGVRVFRGTSTACASCHTDVHRGQFKDSRGTTAASRSRCDRCHTSREEWTAGGFDHGKTRFPLDRAHASVSCDRCHAAVRQPDGATTIQYRPLPTECQSCHAIK
jgi:hypothetical protein